jgi:small subunit ribosomal protein S3
MAMEKHFIQEGKIRSEIENYLKSELSSTGYSGINIQKTPLATRIVLYVEKPPLVIGKKGKRINKLTKILKSKYGIDNPAIDVQKIEEPTLDPNIVGRRIALALERGMNRRRIVYKALHAVMSSGAQGVEIVLAGKIVGKGGRARAEKYAVGYMRKSGDSAKMVRKGSTQAYMKAGIIGITVRIVPPNIVFPDQISVKPKVKEEPKEVPVSAAPVESAVAEEAAKEARAEKKPRKKKSAEAAPEAPAAADVIEEVVKEAKAEKKPKALKPKVDAAEDVPKAETEEKKEE